MNTVKPSRRWRLRMNINVDKNTQTGKSRTINASSYSGQMKQVCVRMLEESDQLMIKP